MVVKVSEKDTWRKTKFFFFGMTIKSEQNSKRADKRKKINDENVEEREQESKRMKDVVGEIFFLP